MAATIIATPTLMGQTYRFELIRIEKTIFDKDAQRPVMLYVMNSAQFRKTPPGSNFRQCIEFWWSAMASQGAQDQYGKANLVLAELYAYVCEARSLQDIYLHAHLNSMQVGRSSEFKGKDGHLAVQLEPRHEIPGEEEKRLRMIARSRDVSKVQVALDEILLKTMVVGEHYEANKERADKILWEGIEAFDNAGWPGLRSFAQTQAMAIEKMRKRGNAPADRDFINRFQYECELGFYLCYANAWIGIIPWLKNHAELNASSERWLRVWHAQAQPNESDEPGKSRDPFMGQVLALHPLSVFVLRNPEHLSMVFKWLEHPQFETLVAQNKEGAASEYWEMVGTILVAAAEYALTREKWNETYPEFKQRRNAKGYYEKGRTSQYDADPTNVAIEFEDFASSRKMVCLQCGTALKYLEYELPITSDHQVRVTYKCSACPAQRVVTISADDLKTFLKENPD